MNDSFYKSIIKESPMGYAYHKIICDEEGNPCDYEFLEVNDAFEEYTGMKANNIISKKVTDLIPGIQKSEFDWIGVYGNIALNGGEAELDRFSEPLNKYYRVKVFSPEKYYFITLFYDIIEENIAKQKEINFKKLFDNMQSGAAIYRVINDGKFGKDYIIKDFNKESLRIEGKSRKEVIGKSLLNLRPNIDEFGLIDDFREVWKTGMSKKMPAKLYTDGKFSNWYENSIFKLSSNEIVAIYNDVTQIMQTQEKLKESRNKFEQYITKAPFGIFIADENGKYLEVNEEACSLTGFTKEELLNMDIRKITDSKDHEKALQSFQIVKDKGFNETDLHYITKENEVREWNNRVVKLNEKRYLYFSVDVTDKKNAENKLVESEKRYRNIYDQAAIGIFNTDLLGNIKNANRKFCDILGYSLEEIETLSDSDITHPDEIKQSKKRFKSLLDGKVDSVYTEKRYVKKDGEFVDVILSASVIKDTQGNASSTIATIQDMTAQKNAERELRQSEEEQRMLLDNLQAGVIIHSEDSSITFCNPVAEKLLGLSLKQMQGKTASDPYWKFVSEDGKAMSVEQYPVSRILSSKKAISTFVCGVEGTKINERNWLIVNGYPVFNENKQILRVVISFIDITKSKRNEEAILVSEIKHKAMIANISDVIGILDKNGVIQYNSPNIKKWFGWEPNELLGIHALEIAHPEDVDYVQTELVQLLKQPGESKTIEYRSKCKDGSYKYVHLSAINLLNDNNINGILLNYYDITEQKRLEEEKRQRDAQQVQQQRLESIGTLAGGVAHEINNPINGIMNYGQLILDSSETAGENAEYAKEIIFESERIATIVKNLLQFSRNDKQEHSYASIENIIEHTLSLVKAVIRHDQIDLQIDIQKDLPELKCRSQQIQQVIMNLLTNARDTLNEKYKGYHENKIVKLTCEQFSRQNRKWIRITVEDHGKGVPKPVQKRLFEPFFTTKERDKGTGLGLPISYGIVKEHHGELTFESKEGSFTRFYLELPCDNGWEIGDKE